MAASPPLAPASGGPLYFVLCDYGAQIGHAYVETGPESADRETILKLVAAHQDVEAVRVGDDVIAILALDEVAGIAAIGNDVVAGAADHEVDARAGRPVEASNAAARSSADTVTSFAAGTDQSGRAIPCGRVATVVTGTAHAIPATVPIRTLDL